MTPDTGHTAQDTETSALSWFVLAFHVLARSGCQCVQSCSVQ